MKCLVVIPTYNESSNISSLIKEILKQEDSLDILVIDDSSSDGTGEIVEKIAKENPRIKIFHRKEKLGLGSAYVMGFKYAIESGYDIVFEMDADFSHNPERLPVFLEKIKDYDLVIGSRYLNGISVVNWSLRRLALSLFANYYVRFILNLPLRDCTSGFKCFKKNVLQGINLDKIESDGYAFQIEMNYKTYKKGFNIAEIPIIFIERQSGTSKMDKKIIFEALIMPFKLRLGSIFKKG